MMMSRADGLVQRRNVNRDSADGVSKENGQSTADKLDYEEDIDDGDSKETRLTLMEEVLLLGLKDKEVHCRCAFTSIKIPGPRQPSSTQVYMAEMFTRIPG